MVGLVLCWSFKCGLGLSLCRYLFTTLQVTVLHRPRFDAGAGQGFWAKAAAGPVVKENRHMVAILRVFCGKIKYMLKYRRPFAVIYRQICGI